MTKIKVPQGTGLGSSLSLPRHGPTGGLQNLQRDPVGVKKLSILLGAILVCRGSKCQINFQKTWSGAANPLESYQKWILRFVELKIRDFLGIKFPFWGLVLSCLLIMGIFLFFFAERGRRKRSKNYKHEFARRFRNIDGWKSFRIMEQTTGRALFGSVRSI